MSDTPRTGAIARITEYLEVGGLFNPEIVNVQQHEAVRDTLIQARDELTAANKEIHLLKEQIRVADGAFNHLNERHKLLYDFANRFLNPDDLGFAVNAHLRDDAREALGGKRVETR